MAEHQTADDVPPEPVMIIGPPAPASSARTTMGNRSLVDFRDHWLVFFSHLTDFTPVCTSEFIAFSKAGVDFEALGCVLLALSVDGLFSHTAWARAIEAQFHVRVPFPIAEDPSMAIAHAYGMISPGAGDSATGRATFVIDLDGVVRAILWYPMSTGRSVRGILRLVEALQTSDEHAVSTPEGWRECNEVIEAPPLDLREVLRPGSPDSGWFYRTRKLEGAR